MAGILLQVFIYTLNPSIFFMFNFMYTCFSALYNPCICIFFWLHLSQLRITFWSIFHSIFVVIHDFLFLSFIQLQCVFSIYIKESIYSVGVKHFLLNQYNNRCIFFSPYCRNFLANIYFVRLLFINNSKI